MEKGDDSPRRLDRLDTVPKSKGEKERTTQYLKASTASKRKAKERLERKRQSGSMRSVSELRDKPREEKQGSEGWCSSKNIEEEKGTLKKKKKERRSNLLSKKKPLTGQIKEGVRTMDRISRRTNSLTWGGHAFGQNFCNHKEAQRAWEKEDTGQATQTSDDGKKGQKKPKNPKNQKMQKRFAPRRGKNRHEY